MSMLFCVYAIIVTSTDTWFYQMEDADKLDLTNTYSKCQQAVQHDEGRDLLMPRMVACALANARARYQKAAGNSLV